MEKFEQLHQLLEQSLRDFQAESHVCSDTQEQDLTQALDRLTDRLTEILTTTSDFSPSPHRPTAKDSLVASMTLPLTAKTQFHCVTSCEGLILMATDAAFEILGMDRARMGALTMAEFVPQEEWRSFYSHLQDVTAGHEPLKSVMTIFPATGPSRKVFCMVTPMFDHSEKITAWHWEVTLEAQQISAQPFLQLVQSVEDEIFSGRSVEECLRQICEGLVHTFGFPFVWVATVHEQYGARLCGHAVAASLNWEAHGPHWWAEVSRQNNLLQFFGTSEMSLVHGGDSQPGDMAWFPPDFQLHDTLCIPLGQRDDRSSMLVVCSARPHVFDQTVTGWLRQLGYQLERMIARGSQVERWRLQSAAINAVNGAVCVTDPQGRLEWVNEAYSAMVGGSIQQLLGTPLRSFPFQQLQDLLSLQMASSQQAGYVKSEVMLTGKNGESLVLEQMVAPLVTGQGRITHFVAILYDVTARRTQELLMKHQASHDPLTDLPNRITFEDRLQQALAYARRNGTLLTLFFLDLDNFKTINDQHGHQAGDRVLRVVAKRLVTCVRSTDTVARLCGDEFAVILQGLDHIQDIRQVALKILDCLRPSVRLSGQDIPIQISIGIAVYPKDSTDPHQLLKIADQAMYRAKKNGGQGLFFATSEWNAE